MVNSICQFIEKETYEIEKMMKKFVEGEIDIDSYGKELQERSLNLTKDILVETLELMDQAIKDSLQRKEAYVVEQARQPKELLLPLGSIRFHRTCYTSKKTGKSVYLLDEVVGIGRHQRVTMGAAAAILEEALESSYRKGGEHASLTDQVSRQAVKDLVHGTIIEMPMEKKEKSKVRHLHIEADEDHVAAQFYEKKGDLQRDGDGRKNNTLMPKLVCVYEDIEEESGGRSKAKRYRLTGKHYFCGLYPGKENGRLWEEVRDYIYENYEWECLERIYISGDGAAWIKAGCDILEKAVFVLDRFHMEKYIQRSVSHLLDSASDAKGEIYSAIKEKDRKEVRRIYRHVLELTEKEGKRREVAESLSYLMNNWAGIVIQQEDAGAAWGCHAEGQVSHVLSARMSSRPMGWSRKGADQMARLRAYRMNGGKIIDLLRYQKQKLEKEQKLEKKEELVREMRRSQAARRYAQSLQRHVPGIEAHSMKWMREMLDGQLCS